MLAPAWSEPDSTVTVPAGPEGPPARGRLAAGRLALDERAAGWTGGQPTRSATAVRFACRPACPSGHAAANVLLGPSSSRDALRLGAASYRGAVSGPGGCGPAGLGNARRPTASAAASRACGVSNRFLRRRRSLAVCRWSSQATNGPSGRESPSRRPSTTSVQPGAGRAGRLDQAGALQLLLPSWARHASRRPGSTQSMMASVRKLMAKIRIVRAGRGVIDAAPSALPGRLGSVIVV
jgi:hypothetical protein